MEQSKDRLQVLKKIDEYERNGWFDQDVEEDPPSKVLLPNKIDYLDKKWSSRVKTKLANFIGRCYFDKQIKKGNMRFDPTQGLENLARLDSGAVITCNHFNPFDNYALFNQIEPALKGRNLYKIIREGNYTAFPGLYGFLMRNCNTLPLSSNLDTMRLLLKSVDILLKRGEKILIYPEQGMWWNYKKPRPMKIGAFRFAVKSNVPVVPCFITMRDSDCLGPDGFYIQVYTIHVMAPIYPDISLKEIDRTEKISDENYRVWKETYERVYGAELTYLTTNEGEN